MPVAPPSHFPRDAQGLHVTDQVAAATALHAPTYPQTLLPAHRSLPARCRLLSPANPTPVLISGLLVISQLARATDAYYDALAGCGLMSHMPTLLGHGEAAVRARACNLLGNLGRHR